MSRGSDFYHLPVLCDEVFACLAVRPDGIYVDCTVGGGGHSREIIRRLGDGGRLIGMDRDDAAIKAAKQKLESTPTSGEWVLVRTEFADIQSVLSRFGIEEVDGILADLGVSSAQLDQADRGFSYQQEGPLDMRMDRDLKVSAADLIRDISCDDLASILKRYGEERYAARIAQAICARRIHKPFVETQDLANVIAEAMPARSRRDKHPAKRSFRVADRR